MSMNARDRDTIHPLAERYCEIAHLDVQRERLDRYARTNGLEQVRPVVLIDEVPWGEIDDELLVNRCSPELGWIETPLRRAIYQWEHFQVDLVVPPVFHVTKRIRSTGIGLEVRDRAIKGESGAYISAHEYTDQLRDDQDLEKLRLPEITYDAEATQRALAMAGEVFDGLLPVELRGIAPRYNLWDVIARYRGVDALLLDLAMRPDFMHRTVGRFRDIAAATFRQYEEQGLLEPDLVLLHCTVACSRELPAADFEGKVRMKDVWGRCAAQIFGSVSPRMHDEFDLAYNQELFGECGLLYYGCCEPMDNKVDILRKRFPNLRKITVTPWADPERAAQAMGRDYVMAAKPNPAFVSSPNFNPEPVRKEIECYLEACRRHGTPCEFVLKDISTIANRPENLAHWAETVKEVVDRYEPDQAAGAAAKGNRPPVKVTSRK